MSIFYYDKTFDGLLSVVFDAYKIKHFPQALLAEGDIEPMFMERVHTTVTDSGKSDRVWTALRKKLSKQALNHIHHVWQSELPEADYLIFRYIRKVIDSSHSVETHFADEDVMAMLKLAKKVSKDTMYLIEFVRFQKTTQNIFFAPVAPDYNTLPLALRHFIDRFADQHWALYDIRRGYGFYYDLQRVEQITLPDENALIDGKINPTLLAEDEQQFQTLWRNYFKAITIRERINKRQQRQHMPARFWHLLPEMQN
ncbi:DNA metabolism protein [Limnobaculum zhutongyuii]|uniref:DNA metabolism protein n=1 Tax=Limnobaculum zhutongyuii TaxID=2498113 RepID=A0A411WJE8_9GAMM|nr:TIGR03915 family putative DNA repair protein [Limnobaculum zhutongyuii]QBH96297.1 DNA metabolism protein [Limnobaculum zhutongyuii]TQS87114.1 DNA metabolism protein [Limnobaculum zhutongyuii]